jgi:hypothetical protein
LVDLQGATVVDQAVTISAAEESDSPAVSHPAATPSEHAYATELPLLPPTTANRAQEVFSNMLAKGFILGHNAMARAKALDEKHHITANASQLSANASARVASLDKKIGITQKITAGSAAMNQQVKAVDEKYQVTEKTRSVLIAAEQKINNAGSAIMKNRYVLSGASWVTGAYAKVAKSAGEVGQRAMEKATIFETEEQKHGQSAGSSYEPQSTDGTYTPPPPYPAENAAIAFSSAAESTSGRYLNSSSLDHDQVPSAEPASEPVTKPPPTQGLVL